MKLLLTFIALTILTMSAICEPEGETTTPESNLVLLGMSASDLATFFTDIKLQLPIGPRVTHVQVVSDAHVNVITITKPVRKPLSGGGEEFTFTKKDGKWILSERKTLIY